MFGNEAKPSRIYSYGAWASSANGERVQEQLFLAHRYRNALVELERSRRQQADAVLRAAFPDLEMLEQQATQAEEALLQELDRIKKANAVARGKVATKADRATVAALRVALKEAQQRHRERRKEAFADGTVQERLAEADASAVEQGKALRARCGVFWGTYLAVEHSCQKFRKGPPPKFRRWSGEGKLAVQLQGGLSVADAFLGLDSRLRIQMQPSKKKTPQAVVWLRIGSEGREPIFAQVPFALHRPLPEGAQIKWVYLVRRRVACHNQWSVQFVLSREEWPKADCAPEGIVGVDVGWRVRRGQGLRVAYWVGSDGEEGELILPESVIGRGRLRKKKYRRAGTYGLDRWGKTDNLRSIRDRNFDVARAALAVWLSGRDLPAWLRDATQTLSQWKSPARLAALALQWREHRFEGDKEPFEQLEVWRKQDKHLYEWEANHRQKTLAWRDDLYRNFVAQLRRRYHTLAFENCKWSKLQRRPGSEEAEDSAVRHYQRIAAVGRLIQLLREGFAGECSVDAKHTTDRCHACGQVDEFDRKDLEHTCSRCGELWDIDQNAAKNLLAGASGEVVDEIPVVAR